MTYTSQKQDYEALYGAIRALGSHSHPMESVWLVDTDEEPYEIVKSLIVHVDSDDQLMVTELGGRAFSYGLDEESSGKFIRS